MAAVRHPKGRHVSAGEPPEEVPSSITPCWRALRAYAGITPALRQQPPEGGCIYSPSGRAAAKGGCFAAEGNHPPGVVLRTGGYVPMYLTSFVNMGLRKRQPPPEVIPRRKQARTFGGQRQPPSGGCCAREGGVCPHVPHFVRLHGAIEKATSSGG